ncbi:DNA gyrase inhibitor YacG [Comamonas sp. UBA7528]|jgi:endogenous inhibitor of DNA gyrase (YacG/DUF329 family)|uniref:DNA gyrase inhibitor YacG n=1 Tax=Comamonas sp. UBA7528 TaxID=1946391 RepID=UPI001B68FA3E|nr:DNA gyrase inhibitor YacG [Comamonas sp. UBA7528]MBP7353406.1 DNA gyrase inhibitor YacG [Comamonas sp.]
MTTPADPSSPSSANPDAPVVNCPTCGQATLFARSNRFRPFCSERCKMIDLGAWGNEEFRVPVQTPPQDAQYGDPRFED